MRPQASPEFGPDLLALVEEAERRSPPSPHRHFVHLLVELCHQATGAVYAESWYRKLIESAGSTRRPSTRTVNNVVAAIKESNGMAPGPTQATVKTLRSQYQGISELVARMEKAVERLAVISERQLAISQSLDRRQQLFSDQSLTYQRQIDGLAEIVRTQSTAAREASKAASEIGLQTARALRDIQASLTRPPN